jgi:hypothetical protein
LIRLLLRSIGVRLPTPTDTHSSLLIRHFGTRLQWADQQVASFSVTRDKALPSVARKASFVSCGNLVEQGLHLATFRLDQIEIRIRGIGRE